jgi:hypothetical protein
MRFLETALNSTEAAADEEKFGLIDGMLLMTRTIQHKQQCRKVGKSYSTNSIRSCHCCNSPSLKRENNEVRVT